MKEKKSRRSHTIKLLVIGVVVVALVVIILNWQTIFAPLRDAFLPVGKGGFPVILPGSTAYDMGELGGNFYLLTDTYLYTYNGDGAEIKSIRHGFNRPASSSADRRVLVYDKNGRELKMYSKSEEIFSKTMEDAVVFAQMGSNERCAVVTTSTRYSNYMYILNGEGKQIFRWASPNEKIMNVCFADSGSYVYVSVAGEKNGELNCSVLCFDTSKEQGELWRASTGSSISYTLEYYNSGVYTVTERGAYLFDRETGEEKAGTEFTKQVKGACGSDGARITLFRDSASNGVTAVSYSETLEPLSSLSIGEADAFEVDGQTLYVLCGNELTAYGKELDERKKYPLDDEYSDLMIMNGSAYLLGYNTVSRIKL